MALLFTSAHSVLVKVSNLVFLFTWIVATFSVNDICTFKKSLQPRSVIDPEEPVELCARWGFNRVEGGEGGSHISQRATQAEAAGLGLEWKAKGRGPAPFLLILSLCLLFMFRAMIGPDRDRLDCWFHLVLPRSRLIFVKTDVVRGCQCQTGEAAAESGEAWEGNAANSRQS